LHIVAGFSVVVMYHVKSDLSAPVPASRNKCCQKRQKPWKFYGSILQTVYYKLLANLCFSEAYYLLL